MSKHSQEWWPEGGPALGDVLAADLSAVAAVNLINEIAVELVLDAACREAVRQIRAGETSYICLLADAVRATELLLDGAA